jgi:orotidine-5'-phosphate decarboxylase
MDPSKNPIIVALDVPRVIDARRLVDALHEDVHGFKIGLQFLTAALVDMTHGSGGMQTLLDLRSFFAETRGRLMWDNKFSYISNTVMGAMNALGPIAPWAVTVHATSGRKAVEAAVANRNQSLVLGVTVLTSIENEETRRVYGMDAEELVILYARELVAAGAQGIVCAPQEVPVLLRSGSFNHMEFVTPNIKPSWMPATDQSVDRSCTPQEAILGGATKLVIGRAITKPPSEIGSPIEAAKRILAEIFG